MEEQEVTRKFLLSYIRDILGPSYNYVKVNRNIQDYNKRGWDNKKIYDLCHYWFKVRGGDPLKSNGGIAILGYIEDDYNIWKQQQEKKQKRIKHIQEKLSNFNPKEQSKKYKVSPKPISKPIGIDFFELD